MLIVIVLPWIPESPRWLLAHNREAEARQLLAKHHANGAQDDELVDWEVYEIKGALAAEAAHMEAGWSILWQTKANVKRMCCTISVFMLCLWYGQGVISYYFSPILTQVGITGTNQQTGINGGMQIWNFLVSIAGAILADKIGRRTLWMVSFIAMILANIGTIVSSAIVAHDSTNRVAAAFVIVFLFLYNAGFNIACNPLAYSYPTEILPYAMRTKGLSVMVAVGQALLIVNQVGTSPLLSTVHTANTESVRQPDRHRPHRLVLLDLLPRNALLGPGLDLLDVPRDQGPDAGRDQPFVRGR